MNMEQARACFTSDSGDWATPQALVAAIERKLGLRFTLDVCASDENAKCRDWISQASDALVSCPWNCKNLGAEVCWMNPPYGKQIGLWTARALHQVKAHRITVVGLLPARTDTMWWHRDVMQARRVLLVKGRVRFVGAPKNAPFPSAVIVWDWPHCMHRQEQILFEALEPSLEERGCR